MRSSCFWLRQTFLGFAAGRRLERCGDFSGWSIAGASNSPDLLKDTQPCSLGGPTGQTHLCLLPNRCYSQKNATVQTPVLSVSSESAHEPLLGFISILPLTRSWSDPRHPRAFLTLGQRGKGAMAPWAGPYLLCSLFFHSNAPFSNPPISPYTSRLHLSPSAAAALFQHTLVQSLFYFALPPAFPESILLTQLHTNTLHNRLVELQILPLNTRPNVLFLNQSPRSPPKCVSLPLPSSPLRA
jgi:hypothetical protein